MTALVKIKRTGEMFIAYCRDDKNRIKLWSRCSNDSMLLEYWLEIVEELDMPMEEIRLKYPEYFV